MKTVFIIGIGMGNPDTLTVGGLRRIQESRALIGGRRMVEAFENQQAETCFAVSPPEILKWIREHEDLDPVSVLMSGDVGFFSGAKKLIKRIEEETEYRAELIPGISSLQYFCGRLGIPWEDVRSVSLHGRKSNFVSEIRTHEKTFLLTDRTHSPGHICAQLAEAGLGQLPVAVGERLSYEDEKITTGTASELSQKTFDPLSVLLVFNKHAGRRSGQPVTHGMADDLFIRGNVPMTKEEVRSVTLSKLRIGRDDILYDVGAGTGSVSVEMAIQACGGSVYAIESKPEAADLIQKNKEAFNVNNLHIVHGTAPEAMDSLPVPDKAFIGGSRGNMREIIGELIKKNPKIRIAVNAISLESLHEAMESFVHFDMEAEVVQVAVSRAKKVADYHMMMGQNPVFIITGQRKEREE
ncbi:precorrin-6y C5,15-methyltransferase (decarboxylating) subunit CbiE [Anaerovorax odorimutans]|uniref:Precorrin-6y C5,15-methyltransferase (Decarboxylating) subunit CbiE n=1 Tax=Anaerovorax odorimutans TaxID=109327 RepID=A0ABT1RMI8_9FIRM|nr:precorrin-6y C5,15-methyltransferase (decarboxylating) subunit CbiE [Anaerovorax odorimutans]MCQ4636387.1 precorrin-6y C5,15-methyltransferase (decarboxylating) subunit CbiE [Anaerovorax odorimutans]